MNNWETLPLADAGVQLLDCVHKTPPAAPDGFPYVAIPQMKDGELDLRSARKISSLDFEEWTRKVRPTKFDVVLSRRCNPGETAIVREGMDFALGQNLVILRSNNTKIRPAFLIWLVRTQFWWEQVHKYINVGAVFDSLRCADVPNFTLPIPPLSDQDAIAALLGSLDDKIELNRRMNETLEEMARTIFKDWFVDFGPVRAKAEGRHPPGLVPEIAALFPDALDDEDKPLGWPARPLNDFVQIVGGGTPKTSVTEYWGGNIPWFSVVDTPANGSVFVIQTEKNITERGLSESAARLVPAGTTIISARGTVGNLAMTGVEMAFNQSCYALRHTNVTGDCFVYLAAQHMVARLQVMAHGSVFSTITRQTFEAVSLAMPSPGTLAAFEKQVAPLFLRIQANAFETRTLAQIRDLLLPNLMSGEIRIRDAERAIETAA